MYLSLAFRSQQQGGLRTWTHRGGMPVKAVCAEVGHSLLVAVVCCEQGSVRQKSLSSIPKPCQQGDNLLHGLLNDVPGLGRRDSILKQFWLNVLSLGPSVRSTYKEVSWHSLQPTKQVDKCIQERWKVCMVSVTLQRSGLLDLLPPWKHCSLMPGGRAAMSDLYPPPKHTASLLI